MAANKDAGRALYNMAMLTAKTDWDNSDQEAEDWESIFLTFLSLLGGQMLPIHATRHPMTEPRPNCIMCLASRLHYILTPGEETDTPDTTEDTTPEA